MSDTYNESGTNASGGNSSSIWSSLFQGAASVTNTALIANANPVNAALLTNTPISTPYATTGLAGTSNTLFIVGALALGAIVLVAAMRR